MYPPLNDATHDRNEAKSLYEDHADIKVRMFELERLLKSRQDWSGQVRDLREKSDARRTRSLSGQIRLEENIGAVTPHRDQP